MTVLKAEELSRRIAIIIAVFAVGSVLLPFLAYGNEYIFKVHDYMDSYLGYMHILRELPLFPSVETTVGVMGDMPAYYFFPEFNFYRFLNYYFDFVVAEFLNRAFSVGIGFFSMKYLLNAIFKSEYLPQAMVVIIAVAYAVSPVYPSWSLGFALLPWMMATLFRFWCHPSEKIPCCILSYLLVPFFFDFSCLGLFLCFFWFLVVIAYWGIYKEINRPMLISLILMSMSFCVTNAYLFLLAFSGVETNRLLMSSNNYASFGELIYHVFREFRLSLIHGQYHAKPIFQVIAPICGLGGIWCYYLYRRQQLPSEDILLGKRLFNLFVGICAIAMIYALDDAGVIRIVFSYVMPILAGFNFGRLIYLNNVFWYILFVGILSILLSHYKQRIFITGIVLLHLLVALFNGGQSRYNFFHFYYAERLSEVHDYVPYCQFVDKDFWNRLKDKIRYQNEKVICVGFHPSVAMTNDFNTMDGYLSLHPMSYHRKFREIIAPTLEIYPTIRNYYDTWGGRMYVYADSTKNPTVDKSKSVEQKELHINTEAFKQQGGRYILSRYILTNAKELQLEMICDYDEPNSLYHIFVYQAL